MNEYDVIVIGSGFGGAVNACRLSEAGYKVLVLERGRRWTPDSYPRALGDPWIWDQQKPEKHNGWIDLRFMDDMIVAQGAGVGGGSLIYANISVEAKPSAFRTGWPAEISHQALQPYYERVGKMLDVQTLPANQLTERYKLMRDGAQALDASARFRALPLAVSFDANYSYERPDPFHDKHSVRFTNAFGKEQGTCTHCGNCDIGCQVSAKNTLDLNYLARAEQLGAQVRPLHMVYNISQERGRYLVHFNRLEHGALVPGYESAAQVILAAGSLGSTELLLRARDQHRTLPKLSAWLGKRWSSNGDFLTPASYVNRKVSPTHGPTITCAIDYLDGDDNGREFFVEDGGFPNLLRDFLQTGKRGSLRHRAIRQWLGSLSADGDPLAHVMPWFGQAMDAADGTLSLGRTWYAPWRRQLKLDWDIARSKATIDAMIAMHTRLSAATGGVAQVPPTYTLAKLLVTPHPLGGCGMGATPADGVVNHAGQVFGYPGLYVADGAIIPRALGLNPSRTIAALAERIAERIVQSGKALQHSDIPPT